MPDPRAYDEVPHLVVLDCDGVLVDTERLTVEVEARVLTELGWPHTVAEVVAHWMGRSSAAQLEEVAARLGAEVAAHFDEVTTAELHAAFDRELTAVEGVEELLDGLLAAGVPTCVASSGSHERIGRTLGITGLLPRFEGRIFSAADVERGKPAPDLFLHAATVLGADPARCAVVEDSAPGVRAGVAAGMTVHGFAGGLTPAADLEAAGAVLFDRMPDLLPLLTGPASDPGSDPGSDSGSGSAPSSR